MRNVRNVRTGIETGVLWRLIVRDVRCTVPDHRERRERKRKKERNRERRKNRSRSRMGNGQREAEEKGREGKKGYHIISYHIVTYRIVSCHIICIVSCYAIPWGRR